MNLNLIKMEKLEVKHLAAYLPYGLKVQYSGILNGKELSEYDKRFKEATKDDFFATFSETPPDEVIGLKVGKIRIVEVCDKFTKYRIGGRGKQTHYGAEKFKPILKPLADYLDINSKASNELNLDVTTLIELNEVANKHRGYWSASYGTIQMMCENHIDFQDLISQGLAIDINTINK